MKTSFEASSFLNSDEGLPLEVAKGAVSATVRFTPESTSSETVPVEGVTTEGAMIGP